MPDRGMRRRRTTELRTSSSTWHSRYVGYFQSALASIYADISLESLYLLFFYQPLNISIRNSDTRFREQASGVASTSNWRSRTWVLTWMPTQVASRLSTMPSASRMTLNDVGYFFFLNFTFSVENSYDKKKAEQFSNIILAFDIRISWCVFSKIVLYLFKTFEHIVFSGWNSLGHSAAQQIQQARHREWAGSDFEGDAGSRAGMLFLLCFSRIIFTRWKWRGGSIFLRDGHKLKKTK